MSQEATSHMWAHSKHFQRNWIIFTENNTYTWWPRSAYKGRKLASFDCVGFWGCLASIKGSLYHPLSPLPPHALARSTSISSPLLPLHPFILDTSAPLHWYALTTSMMSPIDTNSQSDTEMMRMTRHNLHYTRALQGLWPLLPSLPFSVPFRVMTKMALMSTTTVAASLR